MLTHAFALLPAISISIHVTQTYWWGGDTTNVCFKARDRVIDSVVNRGGRRSATGTGSGEAVDGGGGAGGSGAEAPALTACAEGREEGQQEPAERANGGRLEPLPAAKQAQLEMAEACDTI